MTQPPSYPGDQPDSPHTPVTPVTPGSDGSAPIPRPPSEHPLRPNLAPPGSTPAPSPYEMERAAHPPQYNPYADPLVNPYGILPPPAHGVPGAPEPYAHWLRRVAAWFLDVLVQVPFLIVAMIGFGVLSSGLDAAGNVVNGGTVTIGVIIAVAAGIGSVVFSIWNQIFRQGRRGASLGKQWMQIVVVGESDGRPIGALMTFVRQIMHIVDALACYIGYLWPLWDHKRQTFADKIMSTVVLYLPPEL